MSTDQQDANFFSQWVNLQKNLSTQWMNMFQADNSKLDSVENVEDRADFFNMHNLFNNWNEVLLQSYSKNSEPHIALDLIEKMMNASFFLLSLNEFFKRAIHDVPEITKASGNQNELDEIFNKWVTDYKKTVCPLLDSSGLENLKIYLDSWLSITQINQQTTGLFMNPLFQSLPQWQSIVDQTAKGNREGVRSIHSVLRDTYNETLGRIFKIPGFGLTKAQTEEIRRAYDAFNQFLNSLPIFNQHFYNTGLDALKDVFKQIQNLEITDITPETMHELYNIWWKTNEKQFFLLFKSSEFSESMNEVVSQGFYLKQHIDIINAEWCKTMSIPSLKEFDEMALTIHELRKQVRLQQKTLDDLQTKNRLSE